MDSPSRMILGQFIHSLPDDQRDPRHQRAHKWERGFLVREGVKAGPSAGGPVDVPDLILPCHDNPYSFAF